jgi:hypothetical protein
MRASSFWSKLALLHGPSMLLSFVLCTGGRQIYAKAGESKRSIIAYRLGPSAMITCHYDDRRHLVFASAMRWLGWLEGQVVGRFYL